MSRRAGRLNFYNLNTSCARQMCSDASMLCKLVVATVLAHGGLQRRPRAAHVAVVLQRKRKMLLVNIGAVLALRHRGGLFASPMAGFTGGFDITVVELTSGRETCAGSRGGRLPEALRTSAPGVPHNRNDTWRRPGRGLENMARLRRVLLAMEEGRRKLGPREVSGSLDGNHRRLRRRNRRRLVEWTGPGAAAAVAGPGAPATIARALRTGPRSTPQPLA